MIELNEIYFTKKKILRNIHVSTSMLSLLQKRLLKMECQALLCARWPCVRLCKQQQLERKGWFVIVGTIVIETCML